MGSGYIIKFHFNKTSGFLVLSVTILLSIMFQIYWIDVTIDNGVLYIEGGGVQRSLLKVTSLIILYASLFRLFSVKAFLHNSVLKIPILYYLATVIVVIPFIYTNPYFMAVNLLLFAPLLCIDFSGFYGERVFEHLVKIVILVICLQLIIDLSLKVLGLNLVASVLGGMGNANTFGLHLIVAGLGLRLIFRRPMLSNIIMLCTWGTGSLICAGVGSALVFQNVVMNLWRKPAGALLVIGCVLVFLVNFADTVLSGEFGPLQHAYMKLDGLITVILSGADTSTVGSISGREKYTAQGLSLLSAYPLAVIFGHPDFMPFYSGDGFYVALAVTLGVPMTVFFLISHFYMIFLGVKEGTPLARFCAYVIFVYLLFFASNRILDYWPSGFIYLLVVCYLLRRQLSLSRREPLSHVYNVGAGKS